MNEQIVYVVDYFDDEQTMPGDYVRAVPDGFEAIVAAPTKVVDGVEHWDPLSLGTVATIKQALNRIYAWDQYDFQVKTEH